MLKFFFFFFFLFVTLNASEKVAIYATALTSNNNIVKATGGVSVVYKDYLLSSKSATYNRITGDLELFGNIRVNNKGKYKILGKYAKLNIAKKEKTFEPFYMLDNNSQVWLSANKGNSQDETIKISSGVISGCNPTDPLWTMEFSSSDYDASTKWINLYNTRLYIYDILVFYTPYIGYSLDTTRRTGLLTPALGLSASEGFYMQQPFYIAEQNWWDLELLPQIRTNRGAGIYQTFRFVDSKTSHGEFRAGYFKEKEQYFKENNLENRSHFGYNFKYDNNDFVNQWFHKNYSGQSGIYVDINHMNDVDYINLTTNDTINQATSTQILSRINIFYNTDKNYFGTYFKYYEDLTLRRNDETLQKLPTLHYHHYLNTLLKDHLLYSLDVQSNNIYRTKNKRAIQTDINLPISLQTALFDEYLNVSYQANLFLQHSSFSGTQETPVVGLEYNNGYYARNYHTLAASTQLTKAYGSFTHVVGLSLSYNQSSWETKSGFYKDVSDYCSNAVNLSDSDYTTKCEFYNLQDIENDTKIDFTQYFYDNRHKEILYQRLSQKISYSNTKERYGELENELDYKVTDYLSFYNNMFYNYNENRFSKIFNKASINKAGVTLAVSHLFKDSFLPATPTYSPYTSYITTSFDYAYSKHYSYSATYNYDFETYKKKSASIGFLYKKRCWNFGIKYSENNRPILTNASTTKSSIYDKYVYLTIVLKPFMKPRAGSSLVSYKLAN
ncbi:LPS-assembly protein LptD [Sulfurimonas sp.]